MRFIDPSSYVQSWVSNRATSLEFVGATGTVSGPYTIYTFTTAGTNNIQVRGQGVVDILMVGGGGGGASLGGGGGAGGYIYRQNTVLVGSNNAKNLPAADNYIQIGTGGLGPSTSPSHGPRAGSGTPTKIVCDGVAIIEAVGGGGGGGYSTGDAAFQDPANGQYLGLHTSINPASPIPSQVGPSFAGVRGGSGGGGSAAPNPTNSSPGGAGVFGQGHPGGLGHHSNNHKGGGGGGAGQMGGWTSPSWPGNRQHISGSGGDGLANDISGTERHYAGGGGGGGHWGGWVHAGIGGRGGGGNCGNYSPNHGSNAPAIANTGGGGGGGENPAQQSQGASGIIIVRVNNTLQQPRSSIRYHSPSGTSI